MGKARRAVVAVVMAVVVGGSVAASCGGDDTSSDDTSSDDTGSTVATTRAADTSSATVATSVGDATATSTTGSGADGDAASTAVPTSADAGDPGAEECTEERVGGELTLGRGGEPRSLDPIGIPGTGNQGGNELIPIYDTLVRYDAQSDEFVPVVAESLEPNADFTEWTLLLREEVTFGNGDPLTAEAVQASFARHQDPANRSALHAESLAVTEMEVVDPLTLVFRLDAPWARFPSLLAHVAGMVTNQAVVDELGPEEFRANPVGAGVGPYEVERWVAGEELVLRAKDDWWGGPVCIQQLRFTPIPGADAIYDAFRNGDIQIAYDREPTTRVRAVEDGYNVLTTVQSSGSVFVLNHASGPTADPVVRQAVAAAIDPEVINERVFDGNGLATTAIIAEESVHYDGLAGPQPDAAGAAELVEQAKAGGWDGRIELLCQSTPESQEVCLAAKAMLDAAGMETTIDAKAVADFVEQVVVDRNFQVAASAMPLSDADPSVRLSAATSSDGTQNYGGYANPEMDAALDALREAADDAARKEALAEIQAIWNETLPGIVYQTVEETFVLADSVKGVLLSQNSQIHFDKAFLEE